MPPVSEWFSVALDDASFTLDVRPPGGEAWSQRLLFADVIRVCLETEPGFEGSDRIYVFTNARPESWVIPTEAAGGTEVLMALCDHGLFKHELVIEATTKGEGLFCWPPVPDAD
jgi:hypothetical protein